MRCDNSNKDNRDVDNKNRCVTSIVKARDNGCNYSEIGYKDNDSEDGKNFTNVKKLGKGVCGESGVASTNDPPSSPDGSRYPSTPNHPSNPNILICEYAHMNNLPCDYCNRCSASLRSASDCTIVAGRLSRRQITTTHKHYTTMKRKNVFGQDFEIETAQILSLVRVDRDGDGNKLEVPFIAMLLSNGDSINANLRAVSRAVSHGLRWEHVSMLKGATVAYCVSERVSGETFTWRPGDTRELVATSDGVYKSLLGITVRERHEDAIESLPLYVAEADDEEVADDSQSSGIPVGSEPVIEPEKADKRATKK